MNWKVTVKDWFHEKKMQEQQRLVNSTHVVAISEQSEKAARVWVCSGTRMMTYWCPRSCMIVEQTGSKFNPLTDVTYCKTDGEAVDVCRFYLSYWS